MKLLAVVWDFNPTLIEIFGFEIRWYSLCWVLALLVGGWLFSYFCKREGKPESVSDRAFLYIVLGTIIGARVGHCLFYEPEVYLREPWRIITGIRDGGLASHGATIGIILGIWLSSRKSKVSVLWTADRLGVIAPISGAIIRLGNLFNSEIVGDVTTVPWGFKFLRLYPNIPVEDVPMRHPTQLYEAICYFIIFLVLFLVYHKTKLARREGFIFGAALVGIFLSRIIIEFIKINQVAFEESMTFNMGQWLSLPFVLVGVAMMVWSCQRKPVAESVPTPARKENGTPNKKKRHFNKR
ncbi:MAG: prolipoprotein diacylglyceryl transferase [Alistipes sp.]|nr:prolipoprotein diacylglyceryl transferase [Alistipes sp.]